MVNFYHMHSTECYAIIARWPSALVTLTNLTSSKICYVGYTETKEVFKKLKLQFVSASILVQSKMQSTVDFHLMSHICWGKFSILDPHRGQAWCPPLPVFCWEWNTRTWNNSVLHLPTRLASCPWRSETLFGRPYRMTEATHPWAASTVCPLLILLTCTSLGPYSHVYLSHWDEWNQLFFKTLFLVTIITGLLKDT